MTVKQIEERQAAEAKKFEIAKHIRNILDEAKAGADDPDYFETEVLDLVTE